MKFNRKYIDLPLIPGVNSFIDETIMVKVDPRNPNKVKY